MRTFRRVASVASLTLALVGAAACVDLFHATDFDTLCTTDAAACAPSSDGAPPDSSRDVEVSPEAAAPPIDFCTYSAKEAHAHAQRACAWVGACLGPTEESSFGACMLRAEAAYNCALNPELRPRGETAELWRCLADIRSCDEVNRCLFGTTLPPTCNPVDVGTFTGCSTDTGRSGLVECGTFTSPVSVQPCALEGRACAKVDDSKSICAGAKGAACTGAPRCDGTSAVLCKAGSLQADLGLDCATVGGGRCASDKDGVACAPPDDAESCTGTSKVTCDDFGNASSCVDGKLVTIRCGELGFDCNADAGAPGFFPLSACIKKTLDPAMACSTKVDTCSDNKLRSCAQNGSFEIDCASVGLGPCVTPEAGTLARCGAP